jgi:hypothetical protein
MSCHEILSQDIVWNLALEIHNVCYIYQSQGGRERIRKMIIKSFGQVIIDRYCRASCTCSLQELSGDIGYTFREDPRELLFDKNDGVRYDLRVIFFRYHRCKCGCESRQLIQIFDQWPSRCCEHPSIRYVGLTVVIWLRSMLHKLGQRYTFMRSIIGLSDTVIHLNCPIALLFILVMFSTQWKSQWT